MQIDVDPDQVLIENQAVKRPSYIPRGVWMAYWHAVRDKTCPYPNCPLFK